MKKNSSAIIGVVVLVVLVVVGFAIFHKSPKTITTSTKSSSTSAPAVNNAVLTTKTDSSLGQYLANPSGLPLYTYGSDTSGVSNCSGSCLTSWPAYVDSGATTGLPTGVSTIARSDNGQIQYTYNGLPLYTFTGDSVGHVTGNGVSGFSVAKPVASSSSSQSTTNSSTSSNNSSSANNPY